MKRFFLTPALLSLTTLLLAPAAQAGKLADGRWSAADCGTRPAAPAIDPDSVEAYNASLKAVRDWQAKAQAYGNCVVKEANADNDAIARAANAAQEQFRKEVETLQATANAAKAKLDKK